MVAENQTGHRPRNLADNRRGSVNAQPASSQPNTEPAYPLSSLPQQQLTTSYSQLSPLLSGLQGHIAFIASSMHAADWDTGQQPFNSPAGADIDFALTQSSLLSLLSQDVPPIVEVDIRNSESDFENRIDRSSITQETPANIYSPVRLGLARLRPTYPPIQGLTPLPVPWDPNDGQLQFGNINFASLMAESQLGSSQSASPPSQSSQVPECPCRVCGGSINTATCICLDSLSELLNASDANSSSSVPNTSFQQAAPGTSISVVQVPPNIIQLNRIQMPEYFTASMAESVFAIDRERNLVLSDTGNPTPTAPARQLARSTSHGITRRRSALNRTRRPTTNRTRPALASAAGSRRQNFPPETRKALMDLLLSILDNPYPTQNQIKSLQESYGLNRKQIGNWFALQRCRFMERVERNGTIVWRFRTRVV
ncbi:hypothetical protein GQ54DRAFT_7071 [Martensiomyces pterosporus]|nr:hypothetical protein GQ54DRAFT_7071 [Martensiomyces pterosporus]